MSRISDGESGDEELDEVHQLPDQEEEVIESSSKS